jgi:hypothetical protein
MVLLQNMSGSLAISYLHKLVKVPKEAFLVDGQLVVLVQNAVMLHLAPVTYTQRVVTWVVVTFSNQEESVFTRD